MRVSLEREAQRFLLNLKKKHYFLWPFQPLVFETFVSLLSKRHKDLYGIEKIQSSLLSSLVISAARYSNVRVKHLRVMQYILLNLKSHMFDTKSDHLTPWLFGFQYS